MANTETEIVQSRIGLSEAIHREIRIHQNYIAALRNALAGMKLVAAIETPVPIDQKVVAETVVEEHGQPTKGSFIRALSEKIAHAGNGQ